MINTEEMSNSKDDVFFTHKDIKNILVVMRKVVSGNKVSFGDVKDISELDAKFIQDYVEYMFNKGIWVGSSDVFELINKEYNNKLKEYKDKHSKK